MLIRLCKRVITAADVYLFNTIVYFQKKRGLPAQTPKEIRLFKKIFQQYTGKKLRVFEWGSGNSTVYYGQYLASIGCDFEWHAIDNSQQWKDHVEVKVSQHDLQDKIQVHFSEFPAFWEFPDWSWKQRQVPQDVCSHEATEYIEFPKKLVDEAGFDVIIVDGRFRRRCLLLTPDVLASSGIVVLHDAQKDHYHSPLVNFKYQHFFDSGRLHGSNVRMKMWVGSMDINPFVEKHLL